MSTPVRTAPEPGQLALRNGPTPPPPGLPLWFVTAVSALVLVAFLLGLMLGSQRARSLPEPQGTALRLVLDEIVKSHVDAQDANGLLDKGIGAIVDGLDAYSHYVPPAETKRYDEQSTGQYEGVGCLMMPHGDDIVVHFPFADGPAERAGMLPGDRIVAVDGVAIAEFPPERRSAACNQRVRGPAGTDVQLQVQRDDGSLLTLTIRRAAVQRPSTRWARLLDAGLGLGCIHVADFHPGVTAELDAAIQRLDAMAKDGPAGGLLGLVIDLRGNGGGSLDECVAMARRFLRSGTIVSLRRRGDELVQEMRADERQCRFPGLHLVLLVNGQTASASEVLAGALQDHQRAAIVGTRTYGKGVVNTVFSWGDLPFRLKLTTAHYYTPSGRNIEKRHRRNGDGNGDGLGGIAPDREIAVDKATDERIATALAQHEPPPRHAAALAKVAARLGFPPPAAPAVDDDPQLEAALSTLRTTVSGTGNGR